MRVITGSARGRKLKEPSGLKIRPTSGRVKEALFSMIQNGIEGRRVLDLFAGTGQLGIEALSRGAAEAVFVDESPDAVKLVRENLAHCGFEAEVIQGDSLAYLGRCGRFDIIFIDPPYDSGLAAKALDIIQNVDILSVGGIIICECRREKSIPETSSDLHILTQRLYGNALITLYGKSGF